MAVNWIECASDMQNNPKGGLILNYCWPVWGCMAALAAGVSMVGGCMAFLAAGINQKTTFSFLVLCGTIGGSVPPYSVLECLVVTCA
jgi:hypothetical protein